MSSKTTAWTAQFKENMAVEGKKIKDLKAFSLV